MTCLSSSTSCRAPECTAQLDIRPDVPSWPAVVLPSDSRMNLACRPALEGARAAAIRSQRTSQSGTHTFGTSSHMAVLTTAEPGSTVPIRRLTIPSANKLASGGSPRSATRGVTGSPGHQPRLSVSPSVSLAVAVPTGVPVPLGTRAARNCRHRPNERPRRSSAQNLRRCVSPERTNRARRTSPKRGTSQEKGRSNEPRQARKAGDVKEIGRASRGHTHRRYQFVLTAKGPRLPVPTLRSPYNTVAIPLC